jgi:ribosome-associated toxin RatA of RatAB toxin-antitoxin module
VQTIKKSRIVAFTAKQMYELVDNINDYHLYLPWCSKSEEHKRSDNEVTATLSINAQGMEKSFTTRNTLTPHSQIELNLVDGPFSHLTGYWRFCDTDEGCKIDFELNFEISNKILAMFIGPLFEKTAGTMLEAFCKQANKSYSTNDC